MRQRKPKPASRTGVALLALALALVAFVAVASPASAEPDVWRAPTFSGATLDGDSVSLESYRGKPLVLLFWGSW